MAETVYAGGCACGKVRFEYTYSEATKPVFTAYCHCRVCRAAGTTHQALVALPNASFRFTAGEDETTTYEPTPAATRTFCKTCGHFIHQGPKGGPFKAITPNALDVCGQFPAVPALFAPAVHVNFENAVFPDMFKGDGLTKFKVWPGGETIDL